MSKLVVVLLPGGMPEYFTVDDNQTTVTWFPTPKNAGDPGQILPIETYICEGEAFYFARLERQAKDDTASSLTRSIEQNNGSFIRLMSSIKQTVSAFFQLTDMNNTKRIRAK